MQVPKVTELGRNLKRVDIENYTFWYSYDTLVAFVVSGHNLVVHENIWSNTTGKHLNVIDGGRKDERVDTDTFQRLLQELVIRSN